MDIKIDELREAEFVDEWQNGFGWIAKPEENMRRTSHAFVQDGSVCLVDPVDAVNLDQKIGEYGSVNCICLLFGRHVRDSEKLAEKYNCPIYVPEWFERELEAKTKTISNTVPDTDWEIHDVVDSSISREAALYHRETKTLIVADSLGTTKHLRGRGEKLGMSPLYRFNPPRKLLDFDPERIFCGHGEGIRENASELLEKTIQYGQRKTPSAYFNALYHMFRSS